MRRLVANDRGAGFVSRPICPWALGEHQTARGRFGLAAPRLAAATILHSGSRWCRRRRDRWLWLRRPGPEPREHAGRSPSAAGAIAGRAASDTRRLAGRGDKPSIVWKPPASGDPVVVDRTTIQYPLFSTIGRCPQFAKARSRPS